MTVIRRLLFCWPIYREMSKLWCNWASIKDYKSKFSQNGGQNGGNHINFLKNTSNGAYCSYCCQTGDTKSNSFKSKNKLNCNSGTNNNDGQRYKI
jgi:hypothetical protein